MVEVMLSDAKKMTPQDRETALKQYLRWQSHASGDDISTKKVVNFSF